MVEELLTRGDLLGRRELAIKSRRGGGSFVVVTHQLWIGTVSWVGMIMLIHVSHKVNA